MDLMTRRRALLKEAGGVTPPTPGGDWYGVDWFYANSSPQLTRTGAAANFSDPQPATSVSGSGSSPFDNIMPWAGMKRYNIINGAVSYSEDDAGFSQTDYDTVVYIPEFYFKAVKDTTDQVWSWAISSTAQEGFVKHPGSGRYVGRYYTSGTGTSAFTKSGVAPRVSITNVNFRDYSNQKGAKWFMVDMATWSAVQMLYLVEYANFDSQTVLGTGYAGVTSAVAAGGDTDNAAYHTLKISGGHNQYRWVEDPYSNATMWIDGFFGSRNETYTAAKNTEYAGGISDLENLGFALPTSGAIRGFGFSNRAPWAFIPNAADSSDTVYTTFVCDAVYSNSTPSELCPASIGGSYSNFMAFGFFYYSASSKNGTGAATKSSRLIFIP